MLACVPMLLDLFIYLFFKYSFIYLFIYLFITYELLFFFCNRDVSQIDPDCHQMDVVASIHLAEAILQYSCSFDAFIFWPH